MKTGISLWELQAGRCPQVWWKGGPRPVDRGGVPWVTIYYTWTDKQDVVPPGRQGAHQIAR